MRLCSLDNLEEGMVLGKSIYQQNGKLLLSAGFRVSPLIKGKLTERGYSHIYIQEEGTEDVIPEDIISDEVMHQAKANLTSTFEDIEQQTQFSKMTTSNAKKLIDEGYLKKVKITHDIRNIVEEILKDISSAGSQFLNTVMIKSKDSYLVDHSINVTVLSILIGKKYRFNSTELMSLALGAFLHDIGKVIIEKMKDSSDKRSSEMYKEHPTFGYLLLSKSPIVGPIEKQIVNQHHEYQDGSGFPIGMVGQNLAPKKDVPREGKGLIYRLAEICCVADAFDNLAYNPNDDESTPPDQAIKEIINKSGTVYNSDVVQTLLTVVPYYPIGTGIKIIDIIDPNLIGCRGVVAKLNKDNINKPVIILTHDKFLKKIKPTVIDTSKLKTFELKLIL